MKCIDCNQDCSSHTECLAYQNFNNVVLDAKAVAKLRKSIPKATPHFKGLKGWLKEYDHSQWMLANFKDDTDYKYRFMTITFDPKKFSFKELANAPYLHSYVMNALLSIKSYFDGNIILVREYHANGIPHYHMNYSASDQVNHNHILIRMKYYFQQHLNNRHCIHDRIFNDGGKKYITKTNKTYYRFNQIELLD